MRSRIPVCLIEPGHDDFIPLSGIRDFLLSKLEFPNDLPQMFGALLRECIDEVIQTSRTGRKSYSELEKTEKTYIGTRVEIMVRSFFDLKKGKLLDTNINGEEVDIKHTMGNNWMIPLEATNQICLLVAADEKTERCHLGLFCARPQYLTAGKGNRDLKRSLTTEGFKHIVWMLHDAAYPPNFWKNVPSHTMEQIFAGRSGNDRVEMLFRKLTNTPINRDVLNAVARQHDFTRRLRADGNRGVRNKLLREGILILSGNFDTGLIRDLGLKNCAKSEWISYSIDETRDTKILNNHGITYDKHLSDKE